MNLDMKKATQALNGIISRLNGLPQVSVTDFNPKDTVLVIIDIINGFAFEGTLQSPRIAGIVPRIREITEEFFNKDFPILVFADTHNEKSPEFATYPPHCLEGTSECMVVEALAEIGAYNLIPKNSTNGFLEAKFQDWLEANPNINNFVVVGDCTDICIEQFAKTVKAYFNMRNQLVRVVVPMDDVETFDLEATNHYAELMNLMALYGMLSAGVEVVSKINLSPERKRS